MRADWASVLCTKESIHCIDTNDYVHNCPLTALIATSQSMQIPGDAANTAPSNPYLRSARFVLKDNNVFKTRGWRRSSGSSVTHTHISPKSIYHGRTDLFACLYAIGHGGLRVIGGKPIPLPPAMYQQLSQAPGATVISHTTELKLNWNSQVSENARRALLLQAQVQLLIGACVIIFSPPPLWSLLHTDVIFYTGIKFASHQMNHIFSDARKHDERRPSFINAQLCSHPNIFCLNSVAWVIFETRATGCDIRKNGKREEKKSYFTERRLPNESPVRPNAEAGLCWQEQIWTRMDK